MRMSGAALGALGDFVPADNSGFLAVLGPTKGMGDFVPADPNGFLAVLGPSRGMGGLGCGCGGACDSCRSGGMGAIDLSLTGSGIATSISPTLTMIPNWAVYAGGAALAFFLFMPGGHRGRRH